MYRPVKILLLFEIGLLMGIFIVSPKNSSKVLPISSHLPDTFFEEEKNSISLIFTGDVMLGRSVNTRIQKHSDPTWPFKNISSVLQNADLTIINLESPFITDCEPTDSGMIFCADPHSVFGLVDAGIDIASLANNHINNQGQKGIEETVSILKNNNITPIGIDKQYFNSIKDSKLAILSFSDLPQMDEKTMAKQVSEAKKTADITIVTFHWGYEYQKTPNSRQIDLARLAVDSGADLIVGHHPHWIQTEETYQGKPIFYSLGNLVFDQMWSEETRLGEILKVTFIDNQLTKKEIFPIKIFDYGQPNVYSISNLK